MSFQTCLTARQESGKAFRQKNDCDLFCKKNDSISISGHRSVQLFKNGKMGLIYRDIKMNLVEPKYEYIALFGFDGTHLSMRYFIKEGNKISIYNLNGDLIKICDCENPVIGSTDEPSTSNVVLCFGKNGIIKVYNINGEVISLSKVNFQDEQNRCV